MFDPHRTRRSDRRYYTRKGQVLQASRVNTQPVIEQRLVPVYKQYLINNNLVPKEPSPFPPIKIIGVRVGTKDYNFDQGVVHWYTETDTSFTINAQNTNQYGSFVCVFYLNTDGYYKLQFKQYAPNSPISINITDNVKARWKTNPFRNQQEANEFPSAARSLYTEDQIVISALGDDLRIADIIPIEF